MPEQTRIDTGLRPRPDPGSNDGGPERPGELLSAPGFVTGRVVSNQGGPVGDLTLRLYERRFGGQSARVGPEIKTDADGSYRLEYAAELPTNIELRAVDATGHETALSRPRMRVRAREELNVVAPTSLVPRGVEFEQ